ncbi:MAG: hypothetical protein PHR15_00300 [Atopobiaceae bacterium]|jgi:hypothetical protein|nr:hypothetical protein [Atopobiaceae bacterium]MCH4180524.1 hypothetical protein [Atopobiaceae bacterium]MCH4214249.1 hypothetical protein [Atopobiaceae bacterium]MCH4229454.1 hypothetical protein [Atopobiaceae bacterium]MCH4276074.1 hypothetical protein [Atopobiaceae bacterium]
MSYYPIKVKRTISYSMYVEADDDDQALDIARDRLQKKSAILYDQDDNDDFTIRASVEDNDDYPVLATAREALESSLTYTVDSQGEDIDPADESRKPYRPRHERH